MRAGVLSGGRTARLVLPLSVVCGFLLPDLAARLAPLLPALVLLMLVQMMVRLEWPALVRTLRRPGLPLLAVATVLALMPLLVATLVGGIGVRPDLAVALIFGAAAPPLMSAPAFARFLDLDAALALVVMVIGTLLVPFTFPLVVAILIGSGLDVAPERMFLRLAGVIGLAAVLSLLIRRVLGPGRLVRAQPWLDDAGLVVVFLFGIAVMDGVTATLAAAPGNLALYAIAVFILNLGQQVVVFLLFRPIDPVAAVTLGFAGGFRNVGVLFAALPSPIDPALFLFVAVTQFPIYILPGLMYGVYRRLSRRPGTG